MSEGKGWTFVYSPTGVARHVVQRRDGTQIYEGDEQPMVDLFDRVAALETRLNDAESPPGWIVGPKRIIPTLEAIAQDALDRAAKTQDPEERIKQLEAARKANQVAAEWHEVFEWQ